MWLYYYHNDSLLSTLSFMLNLPYFFTEIVLISLDMLEDSN